MPDWRDEYLVNLREAERNNPVNKELIAACSQLADRVAALEAEKAVLQTSMNPAKLTTEKAGKALVVETTPSSDPNIAQLKLDLAEALRAKGQLQHKLKTTDAELQKLRTKTKVEDKRIHDLTTERNALASRLKDRNEELVGKNKMLKDIQDENLTLNIQLNVSDQKAAKVAAENKELVDRWMKRMGQEAEAMNLNLEHRNGR
ncbi:autophagy protein 16 [Pseudomassariella vexata]|uniref:Autophagy protein 16 n=1 Tax=Pseudomassariella vexata TaxID=1141098 RepID=A0A1Y2EEP9_9PEZI|nr:autophagy protein 16 [Pseudomassariella vexata]ORY70039.1 autophagy protein 16 [Pseudomassariella vexata]